MSDPTNLPETMTPEQLEWFILFGICVAGKSAMQATKKLNMLLAFDLPECPQCQSPFQKVRILGLRNVLGTALRHVKMGQYTRIEKAMLAATTTLDVLTLTVRDLEMIPGIGPKTARMVMLYSDPSFNGVPLDTHILKFLKRRGYYQVPSSTPVAGATYRRLEESFQIEAAVRDMTVRELDAIVWNAYQSGDLSQLPGVSYEDA